MDDIKADIVKSFASKKLNLKETSETTNGDIMEPLDPLTVDHRYAQICSAATLQSEPKGFFGELVNNLEAAVGPTWLAEMANLKTDEDKIRFCQRRSEIRESLSGVQPVFRPKDAAMADRLLREASSSLQRGDHDAALPLLNRAAVRSPMGPSLGAVLWTRSGALIAAGNWAAGRTDAETALAQGLPDHRRAEAFVRIGRCHLALGDATRAKIALQLGKRLATERGDAALRTAAERALTKLDVGAATPPATPDGFLDGPIKDPLLPLSTAKRQSAPEYDESVLTVSSAPGAGRFLAAARDIHPGEILLVEKPLAVVPLPDRAGSRCHHCLARLEAARGCSRCSGVAFCSPECASTAESYHKTECQFLGLLEGSGASALTFLALRLVTQKPITFFWRLSSNDSEEDSAIQGYEKVLCLEGHDDIRPHGELFHRAVMALLLLRVLQQSSYFSQSSKTVSVELAKDESAIGGLLLKLLKVLQFNAHEVCETLLPPTGLRSGRQLPLAVAVYPRASLFNHSCNPNVTRYFVGNTLVAAATRHLAAGVATADSYGAQFSRQVLGERRRWLASRYWFVCSCNACRGCWPTTAGLAEDTNNTERGRSQIEEAYRAMNVEDSKKAMKIAVDLLDTTRDSESPPPRWAVEAQDVLRACLASTGNIHRLPSTNNSTGIDRTVATLAIS